MNVFAAAGPECSQPEYLGSVKDFDASLSALKKYFVVPTTTKERKQYVKKLSCLRRPEYLKSFLYQNHGSDATNIVKNIKTLSKKIPRRHTNEAAEFSRFALMMTAVDLSKSLFDEFERHCDPVKIVSAFGEFPEDYYEHMRHYQKAAHKYGLLTYFLEIAKGSQVDALIGAMYEHKKRSMTYVDVVNELVSKTVMVSGVETPALVAFQMYFDGVYNNQLTIYNELKSVVNALGDQALNRVQRGKLLEDISAANKSAYKVQNIVGFYFEHYYFAARFLGLPDSPEYKQYGLAKIDPRELQVAYEDYLIKRAKVVKGLEKDVEWFAADKDKNGDINVNTSQFVKDFEFIKNTLDFLGRDLIRGTDTLLSKFISIEDIDERNEKLLACKSSDAGE